jgi:hypothetical protein
MRLRGIFYIAKFTVYQAFALVQEPAVLSFKPELLKFYISSQEPVAHT